MIAIMEPPLDSLTNALAIHNLSRIPYSIYTPIFDPSDFSQNTDRSSNTLREAERTLKSDGIPVISSLPDRSLWVFHISGLVGPKDGESTSNDDSRKQLSDRLRSQWGLEESSSHVLSSSTISPPPRHPASNPPSTISDRAPVIDLTLDDDDEPSESSEGLTPYQNFMGAVLAVITFHLALHQGFTPLNSRTLASPSSLPPSSEYKTFDEQRGQPELLKSIPVTVPEIVAPLILEVQAYLSSQGSLVITPHSEVQPSIRRLSTANLTLASIKEREVFLAPWGEWGKLCEPNDQVDAASEEKWKSTVTSYLQDYGIISTRRFDDAPASILHDAITTGGWSYVEIWLPSETDDNMADIRRILWPDALIFLRGTEGDKVKALPIPERIKDVTLWKQLFDNPEYWLHTSGTTQFLMATLDTPDRPGQRSERDLGGEWWDVESAVIWAAKWFAGKEERKKAAATHAAEEKKAAIAAQSSTATALALDKGKTRLTNQPGPGGVYPTPPDAAAAGHSHAGFSVTTGTPGAAFLSTGNDLDMDWTGDPGTAGASEKTPALNGETADLFGDDELEFNNITENDFDFFDQPDQEFGDVRDGDLNLDIGGGEVQAPTVDSMELITQETNHLQMDTPMRSQGHSLIMDLTGGPPMQSNIQQNAGPGSQALVVSKPSLEKLQLSPPLSPRGAMKLLLPNFSPPSTDFTFTPTKPPSSMLAPPPAPLNRRQSMYSPILFTDTVAMNDRKYAPGGKFYMDGDHEEPGPRKDPTTLDTKSTKRKRKGLKERKVVIEPPPPEPVEMDHDGMDIDDYYGYQESESSDADDTTDTDESGGGEDEYIGTPRDVDMKSGQFFSATKLKRLKDDDGGHASPAFSSVVGEVEVKDLGPLPWERLAAEVLAEESLLGTFDERGLSTAPMTLSTMGETEKHIVAELVASQVGGWMLSAWNGKNETVSADDDDENTIIIKRRGRRDYELVGEAVRMIFSKQAVVQCDLEKFASIADTVQEPPPLLPPPLQGKARPNPATSKSNTEPDSATKLWDVFYIPPPHVRLQRGDNTLEIMPPALHFWDTFSLAPISGGKNAVSICFHPASSALKEGADYLLERMCASYEAGRFGSHVRANIAKVVENGLVPVELPFDAPRSYDTGMRALISYMESFGAYLAHGIADEQINLVIYIINPFTHPNAIVDISTGFVRMRRTYEGAISTIPAAKPNNLVLQIIPADFVAHKLGPVMRVNIVHRLAIEVYSRCAQTDPGVNFTESCATFSPPIQLTRPLPKSIEFRLTADPSPALLKENQLLHLTYAQSSDERWVAAAWSDSTASLQKTKLYQVGTKNSNYLRPFSEIIAEIWKMTKDLIRHPAVQWRLCIAKIASTIPEDEIATWRSLTNQHSRVSRVYICAADLHPGIEVTENLPELKMELLGGNTNPNQPTGTPGSGAGFAFNPSPGVLGGGTPTPTPGGTILSPAETHTPGGGNIQDAAGDLDADAELVDKCDETWGVVLAHGLPMGVGSERRFRASGMLARRGATGRGWEVEVVVGVVEGGGRGKEGEVDSLREILRAWRGLGVVGGVQVGVERGGWGGRWCEVAVRGVGRVL